MSLIEIQSILAGSVEVDISARWRVEAFSVLGGSVDKERATLNAFVADQVNHVALMARCKGEPAGTCLLAPREIAPVHEVSPWLAGLFVAPAFRCRGIGEALVRAIEAEASTRGHARIYLYTDAAEPYYQRLGWHTIERVDWHGFDTALMARDLGPSSAPPSAS
jgi:predicted N-acetyltransferase YhbS